MKLKAKEVPYSGVVGGGVMLIDPGSGKALGQIMFMCHDETMRSKDVQEKLANVITDAVNVAFTD